MSDHNKTNKRLYRPEIDGIRAFAVLAVIINHFNSDILPNGYLGVDIFFVISGYVITSSLSNRKYVNFWDFIIGFYTRRIKRIIPALFIFFITLTLLISFLNPEPVSSLKTGFYSIFGISNLYLFRNANDYFSQSNVLNPFIHTWSLGVEEQFYVFYPIFFWFSGLAQKKNKRKIFFIFIISFLLIVSLIGFIFFYEQKTTAVYYLMPFRFWEIALGCVAYFLNTNNRLINNNLKNISSSLSILIILLLMLLPLKQPVFLTMAIVFLSSILVLSIIKNTILYRILTHKNIIYIGKISYSLYLWHWGVISISSWTVGLNIPWLYLQILILILISHYSYKYIEQKSTNFLLNFSRAYIFVLGFLVLFISWCFSNILELNRKILFLGNINTGNSIIGEKELYDYNNCFAERYSIKNSDKKDFNNCWMLKRENGQFISKEKRKFFSYGNSFNEHLTPLYAEIVQKVDNLSFNSFFSRGCISSSKIQFSTEIEKGVCNKIFKNYLNFFILNSDKGDSLIISSSYNYFSEKLNDFKVFVNKVDEISEAEALNIWIEELNHIGELLYREEKYLYVISSTPSIKGLPYICVHWYAKLNKECEKAGDKIINKEKDRINYLLENKLKSNNIIFVNIFESVKDLIPKNDLYEFFYNQDHLSIKGARYLLPQFLEVIKKNENFY